MSVGTARGLARVGCLAHGRAFVDPSTHWSHKACESRGASGHDSCSVQTHEALCWHGHGDVRIDTVPDPELKSPGDVIIQVTAAGICGSDLHLLDGYMPTMESGDILGHETMGVVVATGSEVKNVARGDRVVIPFTISCGSCFFCTRVCGAACDTTNPNAAMPRR